MRDAPETCLRQLIQAVENHITALDREMKPGKSTMLRGKRIAALINLLEMSKDIAKRFGIREIEKDRRAARIAKREARLSSGR